VDSTYARAGNVLGAGYNGNFLSCLVAPYFIRV